MDDKSLLFDVSRTVNLWAIAYEQFFHVGTTLLNLLGYFINIANERKDTNIVAIISGRKRGRAYARPNQDRVKRRYKKSDSTDAVLAKTVVIPTKSHNAEN
jgi:hypothetical protein